MIAIIDYGVGNLFSLSHSLAYLGIESQVTSQSADLAAADQVILPGVGAFGDAMKQLEARQLTETVKAVAASGKPFLGICLGMQLLFESSVEFGQHEGLGLIPGEIRSLKTALAQAGEPLKVPHIGWNTLTIQQPACPLLKDFPAESAVYYVHSYYAADCQRHLAATSDYGIAVAGIVQRKNIFGMQFHPEKSGAAGLKLLKAFAEVKAE